MTCLGASLPFLPGGRRDEEDDGAEASRMPLLEEVPSDEHMERLQAYKRRLVQLQEAGLTTRSAQVLFRTYVNGAINHIQRANLTQEAWCLAWDVEVAGMVATWVGQELSQDQRLQVFLPLRDSGMGLGSAEARRAGAFVGSWEQCFSEVAGACGPETAEAVWEAAPLTRDALTRAQGVLRRQGASGSLDWERRLGSPAKRRQKHWVQEVQEAMKGQLEGMVEESERVELRTAGGKGSGGFLEAATEEEQQIPDAHFIRALRRRLRVRPSEMGGTCRHKNKGNGGALCGQALDARGLHARVCNSGGGILRRHDRIRDWLAKWIGKMLGQEVPTEQYVGKWDRWKRDARGQLVLERARLDIVFQGRAGPVYVDIAVVEAGAGAASTLRERSVQDGLAAAREEDDKRRRYPGPDLVPFVVEAGGRLGESAQSLIRSVAPRDPVDRGQEIAAAKRTLSALLQLGNSEVEIGSGWGR